MTVKRGAAHELNIEVTDDEMVFFTVGVDPRYYMYTLSGLVRSKQFTRDQIVARRSLGSKENGRRRNCTSYRTMSMKLPDLCLAPGRCEVEPIRPCVSGPDTDKRVRFGRCE